MPNPALTTYRNGNFAPADNSDLLWTEIVDDDSGLTVWHEIITQDADNVDPPAGNSSPAWGPGIYYWKDTPWQHLGDGIVAFERLYRNIPVDRIDPAGTVVHNYPIPHTVTYQAFDGYTDGPNPVPKYKIVSVTTWENRVASVRAWHYYQYSFNPGMSPPGAGESGLIVHEPGGVTRWRVGIFQALTILVPPNP